MQALYYVNILADTFSQHGNTVSSNGIAKNDFLIYFQKLLIKKFSKTIPIQCDLI